MSKIHKAREQRVAMRLSVRLWGMDSVGKLFNCQAFTINITPLGARIAGINCCLERGAVIGIECGRSRARFRIVWVGQMGAEHEGQIGVRCIEPGKYIWGVPLERKMDKTSAPHLNTPLDSAVVST